MVLIVLSSTLFDSPHQQMAVLTSPFIHGTAESMDVNYGTPSRALLPVA